MCKTISKSGGGAKNAYVFAFRGLSLLIGNFFHFITPSSTLIPKRALDSFILSMHKMYAINEGKKIQNNNFFSPPLPLDMAAKMKK